MWTNSTITDVGRAIIARCIDGEQLKFSRAQLGKGTVSAVDLHRQTEITDFADFATISEVKKVDDGIACVVRITPSSQFTFTVKQIGIFGRLSDDSQDSLIAIYQDETGIVIPGDMPEFLYKFSAIMTIDNTDNIEITIESGIYTTRDEVDEIVESERTMLSGTDSIYNPFGAVYDPGDMVIYKNELWQALLTNRFVTPEEGEYWTKVSLKTLSSEITRLSNITYPTPCNQNLLDNWYFGNPVNQRGQTQYTVSRNAIYTIDRWRLDGAGNVAIIPPQTSILYLGVHTIGNFPMLYQGLPEQLVKSIVGRKVTLSIKAGGVSGSFYLSDAGGLAKDHRDVRIHDGLTSYTFEVNDLSDLNSQGCGVFVWSSTDNASMYIEAFKLELGEAQTLAHTENGNLVINEIPDFGEQLRRCQRYYWRSANGANLTKYQSDGNKYILFIPFPVEMDSQPTIAYTPGLGTIQTVNVNKQRVEFVGLAPSSSESCYINDVVAVVHGLGG